MAEARESSEALRMVRKRWKRKSGYVTPQPMISLKELVQYDFFLNPFYDDWVDWRDGFRDWYKDFKTIKKTTFRYWDKERVKRRTAMNEKQERLLKRREARKQKWFVRNQ